MAITSSDLVVLRKKLEIERKRLDEQERALKIVEDMLREERGAQPELAMQHPPTTFQTGFATAVKVAVREFGTDEFSVPVIERVLQTKGVPIPDKNSRPRIAMVLQELLNKGEIQRTFQGTGSTPHRYVLTKK